MSHFPSRSLLLHPILSVSQPEHPSYIPPLFHTTSLHTNLLQTNDLATQLHHALFELDGGFGYVLKPPELRGGVSSGGGGCLRSQGLGHLSPGSPRRHQPHHLPSGHQHGSMPRVSSCGITHLTPLPRPPYNTTLPPP